MGVVRPPTISAAQATMAAASPWNKAAFIRTPLANPASPATRA